MCGKKLFERAFFHENDGAGAFCSYFAYVTFARAEECRRTEGLARAHIAQEHTVFTVRCAYTHGSVYYNAECTAESGAFVDAFAARKSRRARKHFFFELLGKLAYSAEKKRGKKTSFHFFRYRHKHHKLLNVYQVGHFLKIL
jgi:hypothetical protein